jgi:hypothetical protein
MALKTHSRNGVAIPTNFDKPQPVTAAKSLASAQTQPLNVLYFPFSATTPPSAVQRSQERVNNHHGT